MKTSPVGLLISVVVCTYNRSRLLKIMLDSLCQQELESSRFEVIVVDNNSQDDTRQVVEQFQKRLPQLRYILEMEQGLSNARNRGWREAGGEYVAYVDDDCKASPEWLKRAACVIGEVAPDVFGGPYYAYYLTDKPAWFKDDYGTNVLTEKARLLNAKEYLSGGNIFARRQLLGQSGGFAAEMGMKGSRIAYGEETIFQMKVRKDFPDVKIYYDPSVYVYHLVRPEKMRFSWYARNRFASGRDGYLALIGRNSRGDYRFIAGLLGVPLIIAFEATLGGLLRDRKRYPFFENYFYEHVFDRFTTLGFFYQQMVSTLGFEKK